MSDKLIIRLEAHQLQQPSWAVINAANEVTQLVLNGDPALLAALQKDKQVTVIVPGEDVFLATVTLPKMNRTKLLQAIPFALEEQIIEDVETMHFAITEVKQGEPLPVMVVSKSKMQEWLQIFRDWQVTPSRMLPSMFCLPVIDHAWSLVVDEAVIIRMSMTNGFVCDRNNISDMLMLAMAAAPSPPDALYVKASSDVTITMESSVPVHREVMTREAILQWQVLNTDKEMSVNLMQGEFASKQSRRMPKLSGVLTLTVYLFIAWVIGLFFYPVVSFSILSQQADDTKQQIQAIYKRNFPGSGSMIAPRDRMQQKLNQLTSDIGDNRMLLIMANIGKSLSQSSGVQIKRLDFQGSVMSLEIAAVSSEVFVRFTDSLMQQGLRVKQENANLSGTRVNATLQIE